MRHTPQTETNFANKNATKMYTTWHWLVNASNLGGPILHTSGSCVYHSRATYPFDYGAIISF